MGIRGKVTGSERGRGRFKLGNRDGLRAGKGVTTKG